MTSVRVAWTEPSFYRIVNTGRHVHVSSKSISAHVSAGWGGFFYDGRRSCDLAVDAGTTTSVSVVSPAGQPNPSGDFEIDKNGVLIAYTGSSAEVTIPDGVTEISTEAFENAQLTKLWIPASVRVIGDDAFVSQDLKEITFQDDEAHPSQLSRLGIARSSQRASRPGTDRFRRDDW